MCPFATNEQMILETSKTLNVLYVFNGTYEPYLIYWLFPLQIVFKQITPRGKSFVAKHDCRLAICFTRTLQFYIFFLQWKIFVDILGPLYPN